MTLPKQFSALRAEKKGEIWQWQLKSVTLTPLEAGEVWLQVFLSTINYKDRLGLRPGSKVLRTSPITPGIDLVGEVIESKHLRWQPGDRLLVTGFGYGEKQDGGFAEYAKIHGDHCVALPPNLNMEQALLLGTAGLTAATAILTLEEKRLLCAHAEPIAISGANGAVGSIAISILQQLGQNTTALLRKKEQEPRLKKLGATQILPLDALSKDDTPLRSAVWKGAIDTLGGDVLSWLLSTVRSNGVVCAVGNAASAQFQSSVYPFILRGVSLVGIDSVYLSLEKRHWLWQKLASEWRPLSYFQEQSSKVISLDDLPNELSQVIPQSALQQPILIEVLANARQEGINAELHTLNISKKGSNHISISGHVSAVTSTLFNSILSTTAVVSHKPFILDINNLTIEEEAKDLVRRAIVNLENRCSTVKLIDDQRIFYK